MSETLHLKDVTLPVLERYQRYLYHYRKPNGEPLTFGTQQTRLVPLKAFFQWATRERHLLYNPASELLLPRLPRRLPKHILSVADIESLIGQPDIATPSGLRDRAMLETLYSSGIRRMELVELELYDLDTRGGGLTVRGGKGGRDRVAPLGARACLWLDRYSKKYDRSSSRDRMPAAASSPTLASRSRRTGWGISSSATSSAPASR